MEEKVLKITTVALVVWTVLLCVILPYLPKIHTMQTEAREERLAREELEAEQTKMKDLELLETSDEAGTTGAQLCLNLPEGVTGSAITVTNDYLTQTVRIEIPEIDAYYFDSYPISGSSNHIDTMSYSKDGSEGVIEIVMDRVYELEESYDDEHYYFNFLTPQEVYDKVVVIDAGHGGRAPGASKQGIYEKNIDLAILLRLKEIFDESDENIGVYYTRTDDSNPTFDQRVQLANKSDADLFISIHNNSTGSGRMSSTSGTQVMYNEESESSRQLAQICLEEVTSALGSRNKGLVEGDSIYIIRTSEVPVALIEVGFMTNQEELKRLNSEEYQQQAAQGIYDAILRAFQEGY